ncbi:MAG: hypothetical protein AAGF57_00140 [Pseudomonadota bacterium]
MANVLEFPSNRAQALAYLERQLRTLLSQRGADEELIDFAVTQLTHTYGELSGSEQYSFYVTLPDKLSEDEKTTLREQINKGLEGIRSENHALMVRLIAKLVLTEMRLFQHQRRD